MTLYDTFVDELEKLGAIKLPRFFSQFGKGNIKSLEGYLKARKQTIKGRAAWVSVLKRKIKQGEIRAYKLEQAAKTKVQFKHRGRKAEMKAKAIELKRKAWGRGKNIDRHMTAIGRARRDVKDTESKINRIRKVRLGAGLTVGGIGIAGGTAASMAAQRALQQVQ